MGAVIAGDTSGEVYRLTAVGGNGRELTKKRLDFIQELDTKAILEGVQKAYDPNDPSAAFNADIDYTPSLQADLPADVYPKQMILERGRRVNDYNGASDSGFVVSQKFKDIVEEFDKDEHQFFPVEILNGDHSPYVGGNYYFMHVRQPLDTIITEGSDLRPVMSLSNRPEHKKDLLVGAYSQFTVSAERVNGAGLWLEVRAGTSHFASEALLQRFKAEGVQGWEIIVAFEEV